MKSMGALLGALVVSTGLCASAQAASLIVNGSFEDGPAVPTNPGYSTLSGGDTSITGWTVVGNSIDYIGNYWVASDPAVGGHSLDLSGAVTGAGIAQTISTIVGQAYQVVFDLAGNPDSNDTKNLQLSVFSGAFTGVQDFNFVQDGHTKADMGWLTLTYSFVAQATSTTVQFFSLNNNPYGPALDKVSVSAVPLPLALPLFATALAGLGLVGRRRASRGARSA